MNLMESLRHKSVEKKISLIKKGLPIKTVEMLTDELAIPQYTTLQILDLPNTTFDTKKKREENLPPKSSSAAYRLYDTFMKAVALFDNNKDAARAWFSTKHAALSNHSPLEYCETEIGAKEVEQLIGRIKEGVF
ncbi:MAG: DUF2384 domain-containing protein [Candidatus Margulisbacteria bacterium]|nr:DUF2384 domain-containing protein [Candidatus Margulisiibacteriota bacterium]